MAQKVKFYTYSVPNSTIQLPECIQRFYEDFLNTARIDGYFQIDIWSLFVIMCHKGKKGMQHEIFHYMVGRS